MSNTINNKISTSNENVDNEIHLLLFNNVNEGVAIHEIILDDSNRPIDYKIIDVNPAFELITKINKPEAIGKKATEVYKTATPPYLEIYSNVALTGKSARFETYFSPMQKNFLITVHSPTYGRFITIFSDDTEHKRNEIKMAHLASFPELNPNPIIEFDNNCQLIYANPAATEIITKYPGGDIQKLFGIEIELLKVRFENTKINLIINEVMIGDIWYHQAIYYMPLDNTIRIYNNDIRALFKFK